MRKSVLWIAAFAVLPLVVVAQQASFESETSVVVVEVPVTVISNGEPMRGLTKENFEILDEGKKQNIIGFEVIDLSMVMPSTQAASKEPELPIAARRNFLMLFDLANSDPEAIIKARRAGMDLLDALHPTDSAGVATYSNTRGVDFVLGFTSDRRQVELALETLGLPDLVDRAADPLQLFLGDLPQDASAGNAGERDGAAGGLFSEIADEQLRDLISSATALEQREQRERVVTLTKNMGAMAELLSQIEGQKHVVYFSEGFDDRLLLGEEAGQETRAATESGEIWNVDLGSQFGDTRLQNDLETMLESFRKSGAAIQAVDVGGLKAAGAVGQRASGVNSLNAMARDTGGELFDNFNDLGDAMGRMLDRTSVTYLLAFQPQRLKLDGEYHRLKIKLKGAGRARLSHRDGYYAPKPFTETGAHERRVTTAQSILGGDDGGSIGVDVLAAPIHVPGETPYVPLLVEIDGSSLIAGQDGGVAQIELFAYGFDQDGGVRDFANQTLGLDLTKVRGALEQSGVKYFGHLDLPPGAYSIRVLVRNAQTGRQTLRRVPLVVPAFAQAGAAVLPPMVPEAPGRWLLVREAETRQRQVAYPFMADGQPYIPAVKPVVAKQDGLSVYLPGYNLAAGTTFDAKIIGPDGAPQNAKIELGALQPGDNGSQMVKGRLDTSSLKPGTYTLEVSVKGDSAMTSRIDFVVT